MGLYASPISKFRIYRKIHEFNIQLFEFIRTRDDYVMIANQMNTMLADINSKEVECIDQVRQIFNMIPHNLHGDLDEIIWNKVCECDGLLEENWNNINVFDQKLRVIQIKLKEFVKILRYHRSSIIMISQISIAQPWAIHETAHIEKVKKNLYIEEILGHVFIDAVDMNMNRIQEVHDMAMNIKEFLNSLFIDCEERKEREEREKMEEK